MVAYKEQYGNCNVPQKYNQDPRLGNWVASQRTRKSGLTLEQCAKLDGLGFTWANELCDEQWDEMFRWLERYATLNGGDCNVPTNDNGGNEKRLFLWLGKQRLRKSLLSEDQRTKLDKLGLIWEDANKEKQDYKWNELYDCLKEFREEHGNCRVPQRWDENPALGRWVARQRILYRQGLLPEDRQMQLDRLDFTWNVRKSKKKDYSKETEQWNRSYELLCSFHQEHGHCDVPTTRSYDLSLGNWVADQRKYHKNGILKEDRKKYLDQIGFKWSFENSREEQWLEKYNELKRFQQTNGHMRLPTNTRLATWALRQRVQYAAGKLEPERKEFLDELDFRWLEVSNSGSP